MKNKIGKKIAVLISAILLSASLASCGCRHEVLNWKVLSESTCTTEGKRQGPCVKCGEVVKEAIPINPEAHVYGEWEIEKMPDTTSRGAGKACKICTENAEHVKEITLPRLNVENNYSGYASAEITKPATVLEEGERTLVFAHELGNVQFVIPVEKRVFNPEVALEPDATGDEIAEVVADAVLLAVDGHSQIRSGTGMVDEGMDSGSEHAFSYTYGENYTYTWDEGMSREQWVSLTESGEVFGVYLDGSTFNTPRIYPQVSAKDLQGYAYNIRRVNYATFYGAEGLLDSLYSWGLSENNNRDFWKTVEKRNDGKTYFMFGFGYYSPGNRYFSRLSVEFTLNDELIMDYIRLDTDTYTSENFDIVRSGVNNKTITCTLHQGAQPLYKEHIYYNQITKTQSPAEPEHKYTEKNFRITNLDISYGGKPFTDNAEESPVLSARGTNESRTDVLAISNIQPSTASFTFDPLSVYRVMDNGSRVLLEYDGSRGNISARLQDNSSLAIKVKEAGTITLLLRTQSGYEKTIRFKTTPIAPSTLYPSVNEYSDAGYVWRTEVDNKETIGNSTDYTIKNVTVYVGQKLEFKAVVPKGETMYADPDFAAHVITTNRADAEVVKADGELTATFFGNKIGNYIIELSSALNQNKKAHIRITVIEAPTRESILSGVYTGRITRPTKSNVRITFSETPDENGKIGVLYEVLGKAEQDDGTTVETVERWEKLLIYYDDEIGELITEHVDGAVTKIKFEINEAYRLVLVYPTGGFGGNTLKTIVYHPEPETPSENSEGGNADETGEKS